MTHAVVGLDRTCSHADAALWKLIVVCFVEFTVSIASNGQHQLGGGFRCT